MSVRGGGGVAEVARFANGACSKTLERLLAERLKQLDSTLRQGQRAPCSRMREEGTLQMERRSATHGASGAPPAHSHALHWLGNAVQRLLQLRQALDEQVEFVGSELYRLRPSC